MATIKLVVTGDLEKRALHDSLRRWFPHTKPDGEENLWLPPRKTHAATTSRLTLGAEPSRGMLSLARVVVTELWNPRSRASERPDLVVCVGDLEIANLDQPQVVIEQFRVSVEREIRRRDLGSTTEERLRQRLRESCSFHLLIPMVESYFFGDQAALLRLGVAPATNTHLRSQDVELFETTDPSWLPSCERINIAKEARGEPWWREQCHPKHYLEHLISRDTPKIYDEVADGAPAFESLDWSAVGRPEIALACVMALFEDFADWFEVTNPLGTLKAPAPTYPPRTARRDRLVLRNL